METTKLTNRMMMEGRSENGGWTKDQLKLLGVTWPPPKGWKDACLGNSITEADYRKFLQLRGRK